MKHLNGLDHMFLSLDTATTNGMLGGLVIFEPVAEGERGPDAAFMRERIQDRLDMLPPLRWRHAEVPLELDHDYLAEVDRLDLFAHIHTISLPAPGTQQQLAAEVSRLMSTPLQTGRPLWDLYVIDGLEDGGTAHLLRIHHGVVDGGSMPVLWDLLADEPTEPLTPKWPRPPVGENLGGTPEMLVRGLVGAALRPVRMVGFQAKMTGWLVSRLRRDAGTTLPAMVARMVPGELSAPLSALVNVRQRRAGAPVVQPLIPTLRPPATPFNQKVTSRRTFVFTELPLADLKRLGKSIGGSLNDAVLAVCAGAVREYLEGHGGAPDRPLIVCVPVGLRRPDEEFRWGNQVSMIFAPLPTHLDDPLERLEFAGRAVKTAKANFDEMPVEHLEAASEFLPEAVFAVPAHLMAAAPAWVPTPGSWNVVVSNVRGPSSPAHVAGATVRGYWPASFLSPVGGLNITLQSYTDRVDFGVVACADHVDDLNVFPGLLESSLRKLEEAVAYAAADADVVPLREADAQTPPRPARRQQRSTR